MKKATSRSPLKEPLLEKGLEGSGSGLLYCNFSLEASIKKLVHYKCGMQIADCAMRSLHLKKNSKTCQGCEFNLGSLYF